MCANKPAEYLVYLWWFGLKNFTRGDGHNLNPASEDLERVLDNLDNLDVSVRVIRPLRRETKSTITYSPHMVFV